MKRTLLIGLAILVACGGSTEPEARWYEGVWVLTAPVNDPSAKLEMMSLTLAATTGSQVIQYSFTGGATVVCSGTLDVNWLGESVVTTKRTGNCDPAFYAFSYRRSGAQMTTAWSTASTATLRHP